MKTSHLAAAAAAVLTMSASLTDRACAQIPTIPVGSLTATPTIVRTGTYPALTWTIGYPTIVPQVVTLTPTTPGSYPQTTITATTNIYYDIRVLGAGVTAGSGSSYSYVPTEAQLKIGTGSYTRIWYGTETQVNQSTIVATGQLTTGKTLKFGGRYYYNSAWGTTYTSDSSWSTYNADGPNVRTLVSGQTAPTTLGAMGAPSLADFIKPYLDNDNVVCIGPMDIIVFMELTDTQMTQSGYDLQDMVLLVTFRTS